MTFREKLKIECPGNVDPKFTGGCEGCPANYGYEDNPPYWCSINMETCRKCWDREIPEGEVPYKTIPLTKEEHTSGILDSGARREFETGAVRDIQEGKGRCDLMPLEVVSAFMFDGVINRISSYQVNGETNYLYDALEEYVHRNNLDSNDMFLEVSKHFEEGAKKYGEYNWQKGIPTHCYIDSAVRHYLKHLRGDKDEPHDRAFVWNILCCIWTCEHKPELNDYRKAEGAES